MTEPPGELEARVAALETRVGELVDRLRHSEQAAAAARVLAGGADRDVEQVRGEIRDFRRVTTSNFNAIRENLADLRKHVDDGFATAERGLTEMRRKLDATAAAQQQLVDLLNTLTGRQGNHPA